MSTVSSRVRRRGSDVVGSTASSRSGASRRRESGGERCPRLAISPGLGRLKV
jgi:hypothetical protein